MYIYCLKLKNLKYYIGKTENYEKRIREHFNSQGSNWTKLHSPIEVIFITKLKETQNSHIFENLYTFAYIQKYGAENVRGGDFCQVNKNYGYLESHLKLYSNLSQYLNPTNNLFYLNI